MPIEFGAVTESLRRSGAGARSIEEETEREQATTWRDPKSNFFFLHYSSVSCIPIPLALVRIARPLPAFHSHRYRLRSRSLHISARLNSSRWQTCSGWTTRRGPQTQNRESKERRRGFRAGCSRTRWDPDSSLDSLIRLRHPWLDTSASDARDCYLYGMHLQPFGL